MGVFVTITELKVTYNEECSRVAYDVEFGESRIPK